MNETSRPEPDENDGPVTPPDAEAGALERERDEYLDKLQRLKAEYDNYRRREERERARWAKEAMEGLVLELLPIVDNFARAAAADQGSEGHDDYVAGMRLVEKQLESVLERIGVEPIEAKGKPFDPEVHEALQVVDTNEVAPNHVVSELARGYRMRGDVVRAARVVVARAPAPPADDAAGAGDEED